MIGTFSLHGVNKPVTFHYSAARTGSDIHVQGQVRINLKDILLIRPRASLAG